MDESNFLNIITRVLVRVQFFLLTSEQGLKYIGLKEGAVFDEIGKLDHQSRKISFDHDI